MPRYTLGHVSCLVVGLVLLVLTTACRRTEAQELAGSTELAQVPQESFPPSNGYHWEIAPSALQDLPRNTPAPVRAFPTDTPAPRQLADLDDQLQEWFFRGREEALRSVRGASPDKRRIYSDATAAQYKILIGHYGYAYIASRSYEEVDRMLYRHSGDGIRRLSDQDMVRYARIQEHIYGRACPGVDTPTRMMEALFSLPLPLFREAVDQATRAVAASVKADTHRPPTYFEMEQALDLLMSAMSADEQRRLLHYADNLTSLSGADICQSSVLIIRATVKLGSPRAGAALRTLLQGG